MTQLQGFSRTNRRPGARNHVFILPSVVCSTRLTGEIADAVGAVTVSHQHGCGHIGPDIVQTRQLFAGLAMNPNVCHSLVASLGCETVQGKHVIAELDRQGHTAPLITIQDLGGYDGALTAGVTEAQKLVDDADSQSRSDCTLDQLTLAITVSRRDDRIAELIELAANSDIRVVVAADAGGADEIINGATPVSVGDQARERVSVVEKAGAGTQLLASTAACGAQIIVDFPAGSQPPQGSPLVPVLAVAGEDGLHSMIGGDFDLDDKATARDILGRVVEVFSGGQTKAEQRGSASFAIPRLLRTM